MTNLTQEVDSIISNEGITDAIPAQAPDVPDLAPVVDPPAGPVTPDPVTPPADPTPDPVKPDVPDPAVPAVPEPTTPIAPATPSPTEVVQEAKTLIQNLNLSDDKIFTETGDVRPFKEVVPVGQYLASQLNPVKVTDKDGKQHEFLLISDVEKMFPDGFEAKNNLEQMRFQQAILANETAFQNAVKTYNNAEAQYTKETSDIVQSRGENERIGKEYKAMADAGLVPKLEGDSSDPKFLESPAVKELNKLLEYMDTKNKELSSKGLGQINSLYVAKQLMDIDASAAKKQDTKTAIITERKEVASLSSTPTANADGAKPQPKSSVPMSRLADEIIASEGLR